ncbi:hypothetical protein SLS64_008142 [Diaporthe eres]|uniref:Extracellular dioxygenase n=1 Tax=Diaporthe eres TaxID=83184 RepID=A0ABR1NVJ2_DIAER
MLFTQVTVLAFAVLAATHPGHEDPGYLQAVRARAARTNTKRALEGCTSRLEAQGVRARAMERRKATFDAQRMAKGIPLDTPHAMIHGRRTKRDTPDVLNKNHQGDIDPFKAWVDESYLFNDTTSTVLNPEGDIGPFYVPGEYIRSTLCTNDDCPDGVFVVADIQFINVDTCEPLPDVWADVWSCNATEVYSGIQSDTNGNPSDDANLNNTALRGLQKSDPDGAVQFWYTFPGHYPGRTNHQHIMVHENATVLPNGTLAGDGSISHIGQLFWDQDLIDEVETWSPYTENTALPTLNSEDSVFGEQETADTDSDPVYSYTLFGEDVGLGIFAWTVIGIDPSASYTPTYSFALTEDGGVPVGSNGEGGFFPGGPWGPPLLY